MFPSVSLAWRSVLVLLSVVFLLTALPGRTNAADEIETARTSSTESVVLARRLLERVDIRRGVCAVLGPERDMAVQLARSSQLLVHVREPDAARVAELREAADLGGLGIDRLTVEQGPLGRLPYADNLIDIVIATRMDKDRMAALPAREVLRVLRPGGKAVLGIAGSGQKDTAGLAAELERWADDGGARNIKTWEDDRGTWICCEKSPLEGTDDWTHWEHGPDNNPMSSDRVIQAPYLTQFLAEPYYIGMPAITTAAGGRTFLAIGHIAHHRREWDMLNKLIARNGYNGTVLWERSLGEGYMVHRSAFVATKDTFYLLDGDRCLLLDARTGREKGEIRVPLSYGGGAEGQWKWMAMKDGVLYVLAGPKESGTTTMRGDRTFGGWSWADLSPGYYGRPRVPWGFGNTVAAYHVEKKRLLWKHVEKKPIDSRGMAIGRRRVFFYAPDEHFRAVDAASGDVVWTNDDADTLGLIEEPGRGLTSTPGFRSCCMAVATPKALVIQGQTRMNVVALSTEDGSLLWTKKKTTNNPNAIYVDGHVVLGVGPGGSHVALDPVTGDVVENLGFRKVSCTRLTGCPDSFFCRGEGTLRFDRASKRALIDGAIRPACNDGALPANGLLYIGPWPCDCNLSLLGACAKSSAGDFQFDRPATDEERLKCGEGGIEDVRPLEVTAEDWPTYRANNHRTAATPVRLSRPQGPLQRGAMHGWSHVPKRACLPSAPTAAGGLVFVSGDDGKVRALDADSGSIRWVFATPAPVKMPPTIWQGRAYFGSGDGYVYALEAATGRLLWRFRAAPVERHIMVYGSLASTWPVNTGVLIHEGIAYFAAGIIDSDGTYVYAVDAKTGRIKWHNNTCGHLNPELRKGVSAHGNLTILGNRLLLAGGNQVSPAPFDLETGKCLAPSFTQGQPKANHGQFVGVLDDRYPIAGGRTLYSSPRNVANKDSFFVPVGQRRVTLSFGGVPPAWNDRTMALVNFRSGNLTCCDTAQVSERIAKPIRPVPGQRASRWSSLAGQLQTENASRWESNLNEPNQFEVLSLAICPEAVVAVVRYQHRTRSQPQWFVVALNSRDGTQHPFGRHELPSEPLPGGLLVDRHGHVIVTLLGGTVLCLGNPRN